MRDTTSSPSAPISAAAGAQAQAQAQTQTQPSPSNTNTNTNTINANAPTPTPTPGPSPATTATATATVVADSTSSPPLPAPPPGERQRPIRLLIINPNSTVGMTDALRPVVASLGFPPSFLAPFFFTAPPPSPSSINSPEDAALSADVCLPLLRPMVAEDAEGKEQEGYDAFLVACYSAHPLVPMLRREISRIRAQARNIKGKRRKKYVTGIFEASVLTCLGVVGNNTYREGDGPEDSQDNEKKKEQQEDEDEQENENENENESWGIVSTSPLMGRAIQAAVEKFLLLPPAPAGVPSMDGRTATATATAGGKREGSSRSRFAGVQTTGLTAGELHALPAHIVRGKMMDATKRLLLRRSGSSEESSVEETKSKSPYPYPYPIGAICLGCAGMVGLESAVREACVEVYGEERGSGVRIVDGVKVGVGGLVAWVGSGM